MPRYAVLLDHDQHVAEWTWREFNLFPMPFNMAIGIIDQRSENRLVGAALFDFWNGYNVHLNYYGPGTPTLGIFRILATLALKKFNVVRVTLQTKYSNSHVINAAKKLGFIEECTERDLYGPGTSAQRLVIFRDGIIRLAGKGAQ